MQPSMYAFVIAKLGETPKEFPSARAYWRSLAAATGVSVKTIEKIFRRQIEDPGVSHIEKLADELGYTPRKAAALARRQARQPARVEA